MFKILLPIIFIIGAIGSFVFYTKDLYSQTKLMNQELQSISGALDKATQLRVMRDKLAIERNSISPADLARINKMLPDGVENIGLIIEMNNIARDKGMELLSPSISEASPDAGVGPDSTKYGSIKMTFGVNTTYDKFMDFLKELERSLRLVDVMSISFGAPDEATGRSNFNLTIQTYWLK
jgi:hypothetical protein